jgi:intracellular septation protein
MADALKTPAASWIRYAVDGAAGVVWLVVLLATRGNFAVATWFGLGGCVLSLGVGLAVERRLAPLPAFSGALFLIFGVASLVLHRADILQMKMTIVDGVLGAALFGGLALGKNPLKAILGGAFNLPDRAWRVLAIRYGLFWWGCAIANEAVRRTQTAETWATFRLVVMGAAVVFAIAQAPFMMKHGRIAGSDLPGGGLPGTGLPGTRLRGEDIPEPPESGL